MQTTLAGDVRFDGRGLHGGQAATALLRPAPAGQGIVFCRTDLPGRPLIPARWDHVEQTALNTRIRAGGGASVSTIEHLMAALAACGCHNATVEIDGPEVPILDGSALPFVEGILAAGLRVLAAPLMAIDLLETVTVTHEGARASLAPAPHASMEFIIDFADAAIGHQELSLGLGGDVVLRELADCRTFCRLDDVEAMRAKGLALGGTFENAVVVDGAHILSPGGLRRPDEAVRHKMLDACGDLATAGRPILGHYRGQRAGHALTNRLLRAVFARPQSWRLARVTPAMAACLPGGRMPRIPPLRRAA
ncbi:MAG: UDP-3-O-[3-hydroxymyristoyl] N-acetylglucosamine deacetylase [Rubellimicrobium sp.]|nr:UDP-3-O-[3-hydroxymyristoyl] N-acetylglucosamine deacetylase [Rubellimicrobium sp.]